MPASQDFKNLTDNLGLHFIWKPVEEKKAASL
jgi:hypothetical protein